MRDLDLNELGQVYGAGGVGRRAVSDARADRSRSRKNRSRSRRDRSRSRNRSRT